MERLFLDSKTPTPYQFEPVVGCKSMMVAGVSEFCCSGSESDGTCTSEGKEADQDVDCTGTGANNNKHPNPWDDDGTQYQ